MPVEKSLRCIAGALRSWPHPFAQFRHDFVFSKNMFFNGFGHTALVCGGSSWLTVQRKRLLTKARVLGTRRQMVSQLIITIHEEGLLLDRFKSRML